MTTPRKTSLGRTIVTPIILLVAGYLIAGQAGLMLAGVVAVGYIVWAVRR